jgi:tetratricopeptide (TPR) repeat protein
MTLTQPNRASVRICNRLLAAVLLATAAAYLWTLQFGFVYDDLGQIVSNPLVQSWRYLPMYFRGNVWMQQSPLGNYYRPVFLAWLLLNHTIFGLHPMFWHLTNILAHLGATALVYLLALRLTREQKIAAIAALIFGVHPVHIESVAWISGVTEPLLALLMIPSFLAFMKYREKKGTHWLAISVAWFAVALLAKETAVVLPGLMATYVLLCPDEDWRRKFADAAKVVVPFAAVTLVYLMMRASALHGLVHTTVDLPASISLYTLPSVLWFYLKQLVAPIRLSAFYDTLYVTHVSWKYFLSPLLGVILAAAIIAYAWWRSRSPLVAFAAIWMLLPLAPVMNLSLLPMGDFVHDRYLYLPSIGFALLAGMALARLDAWKIAGRPAGTIAAGVVALVLIAGTGAQSLPWSDDIPLYTHGMKVAPINDLPRNKLAATFVARGMYDQGIRLYSFVLANDPEYWYANYRMGYAQYMTGHYDKAQQFLARSVALNPVPDALYYLGLASTKLKQYDAAESALREALKREPKAPGYSFALGMAMKEQGKLQPALESFRAELAANPNDPGTLAQISEITAKLQPVK